MEREIRKSHNREFDFAVVNRESLENHKLLPPRVLQYPKPAPPRRPKSGGGETISRTKMAR